MCTASWVYPIDWEDHVLTAPFCELGGHSVSILVKCPALGTTSLPELAVMHPWGVSVLYIIPGFCRSCQCTISPLPYLDNSSWCKNMKINQKSRRSTDWNIFWGLVNALLSWLELLAILKCLNHVSLLVPDSHSQPFNVSWVCESVFVLCEVPTFAYPLNVYLMLVVSIKAVVLSF